MRIPGEVAAGRQLMIFGQQAGSLPAELANVCGTSVTASLSAIQAMLSAILRAELTCFSGCLLVGEIPFCEADATWPFSKIQAMLRTKRARFFECLLVGEIPFCEANAA